MDQSNPLLMNQLDASRNLVHMSFKGNSFDFLCRQTRQFGRKSLKMFREIWPSLISLRQTVKCQNLPRTIPECRPCTPRLLEK